MHCLMYDSISDNCPFAKVRSAAGSEGNVKVGVRMEEIRVPRPNFVMDRARRSFSKSVSNASMAMSMRLK